MDEDVFFHQEEMSDNLQVEEGTEVEFEQEEGDRGPKAFKATEA